VLGNSGFLKLITVLQEHSKGNKTVPEKVATTRTEDGHKQNTKISTTI
jgi:hypothetical protein